MAIFWIHGTEVFAGRRQSVELRSRASVLLLRLVVVYFNNLISLPPPPSCLSGTTSAAARRPRPPSPYDSSNAQDASSFLSEVAIPDPSRLHPLAGLNQDTLDYLTLDDSALDSLPGSRSVLPSRGWSDDLCYGAGTTYLAALTVGGAWGLAEGLRKTPVTAPPKIRLNGVLNSITRRGPFLGNSAGVVAMVYNGFNSAIGYARGKHDSANSVVAGALSGMLFKSTRGVKPMMISGGIVASIAGAWAVTRKAFF
ncbi:Mitochondrial import inner membrane translocase subunit tim23 [Penicillium subrubescens]|uniref:Mitochondrial import inner membrane translocase subunit tim23 n=1 Tax=Penicillium subrubescens TaxID=1316194 RepID=UPI0025452565|nr:Mitochondrial import inner membrane translocase subunit tim23 [Penicillium subrubescens]KAJ5880232.1 Mitochondrial import inner membrane translocase subunit tim23 [Penicillium subrubescens]